MNPLRGLSVLLVLLLGASLVVSCSPAGQEDEAAGGPRGSVQTFYRHLNEGDLDQAMSLYSTDARSLFDDPATFEEWAETATRQGTISDVDIVDESVEGTAAKVDFELVFEDGSKESHTVDLVDENGQWKLGMIL